MTAAARVLFRFEDSYARAVPTLSVPWRATPVAAPRLLVLNEELAGELGVDAAALREPEGVALLVGEVPDEVSPVAQAYAGHQFGGWVPRLGDGRALLLGEVLDDDGHRRDLHLKGSGRTPFARGGDGLAAVGPMLREYLTSEAMHALGIPTTRPLAVVATGEQVRRETALPGAVLARVAASHLRVGTFQYAAALDQPGLVAGLADYAIARHHPEAADAANPYLEFYRRVVDAQASLVARWMLVGYAYRNQPVIAQWNLARLAETLLPLIDGDPGTAVEAATDALNTFAQRHDAYWTAGISAKLGLAHADRQLLADLPTLLQTEGVDWTRFFRALSSCVRGDDEPARSLFAEPAEFDTWASRWRSLLPADRDAVAKAMDRVNPIYIPRNHHVEHALNAATDGDLTPFERLLEILTRPYDERPGLTDYALGAPADSSPHVTYCGT